MDNLTQSGLTERSSDVQLPLIYPKVPFYGTFVFGAAVSPLHLASLANMNEAATSQISRYPKYQFLGVGPGQADVGST